MFDWLELLRLEYGGLCRRVRHQILDGKLADLRVGIGDEADELDTMVSRRFTWAKRDCYFFQLGRHIHYCM